MEELISKGLNEDALWRHLWGLAWLAKKRAQKRPPIDAALPGSPPHTLRRFPQKVRRMADEIENLERKMQSNQFYATVTEFLPLFLTPKTAAEFSVRDGLELEDRQERVSRLAQLPTSLRAYADDLATRVKMAAQYGRMDLSRRVWPVQFFRFVEACTGKPHWPEVTTLLNASYQAIGCDDLQVDQKALAMLRSRFDSKK